MKERQLTPDPKPSYEAPEVIEIGGVAELTLGMVNSPKPDGCDCTKGGITFPPPPF